MSRRKARRARAKPKGEGLARAKPQDGTAMRNKPRICAVDDDKDTLRWLQATLGEEYDVELLTSVEELEVLLGHAPPDLILLDVHFPVGDSVDALVRLRERCADAGTPIVLISADNRLDLVLRGISRGADVFMDKPLHPGRLKREVHSLVHRREERASKAPPASGREPRDSS
ncbi:MAG: response regulator [Elusimicrobiota bacterium]